MRFAFSPSRCYGNELSNRAGGLTPELGGRTFGWVTGEEEGKTRSQDRKTVESGMCEAMATGCGEVRAASRWRYEMYVPDVREGGEEVCELIVGRRISTCTRPYSMV